MESQPVYKFTMADAYRIARKLRIERGADPLFRTVNQAIETYEKYLLSPDYHQRKDALKKLGDSIAKVDKTIRQYHSSLEVELREGTVLREIGELLTYEGIDLLAKQDVPRPMTQRSKLMDPKEQDRQERSATAAQFGPDLLISLFDLMKSAIDQRLRFYSENKGGAGIKHPLRGLLIMELADFFILFTGERPTPTPSRRFAELCCEVFQVLGCDMVGLEKALEANLKRARNHRFSLISKFK